jgi:hypothetical protein
VPHVRDDFGWDLDEPGSRFVRRPAFAITIPEAEWPTPGEQRAGSERALRDHVGDWLFEEQNELGAASPVAGSYGRGAAGFAAVAEFVAQWAAAGVISTAAGMAFKHVWRRAIDSLEQRERPGLVVSLGAAAALAAAEVAERYAENGPLEIEAVEEPSSIAGQSVSELSYVGVEPWIVFLRRREQNVRYLVVVAPGGEVLGSLQTPMGEFEHIYLPDVRDVRRTAPARRLRFRFWRHSKQ